MKKASLLVLTCLLAACERVVEIELPVYEQKLVLNGIIDNTTPVNIAVSSSVPAMQVQDPSYMPDVQVLLYGNNILLDTLDYNVFFKKYESFVIPQPGVKYLVQASRNGYDNVSAFAQLPGNGISAQASFTDSTGIDSVGLPTGTLRVVFNDPDNEKNYYRIRFLYYNGSSGEFQPFIYETEDPSLLGPEAEREPDASVLFDDLLFNGQSKEIIITLSSLQATSSPRFLIDFSALGEDYFKYRVSLRKFRENNNNFFAEPVFVYSNVVNGLGIFAGVVNDKDTIK